MKYAAFDLEIVNSIPEGEDWKDHRPLGISCAAVVLRDEKGELDDIVWYKGRPFQPLSGAMSRIELGHMVDDLVRLTNMGYHFLTWNGLGFDFQVLHEESAEDVCKDLAMTHIDMMFQFLCIKGYPLSLAAASEGQGLSGKTEGMSGALAPEMWAKGLEDRKKVLEYVRQDCVATLELAEKIEEQNGILRWTTKKGRPSSTNVGRWRTVREAMSIPQPDTSWMTDPLERENFYKWATE